mmetsp:Transcript_17629/g.45874  ORF Transcript_17629/g.45874 Transcript_17629/m.45874 type:complete len:385 (-) Transcript_17629:78-1232(-)|eukprot:jgi/Tetstr1/444521/TSEL_032400.t1
MRAVASSTAPRGQHHRLPRGARSAAPAPACALRPPLPHRRPGVACPLAPRRTPARRPPTRAAPGDDDQPGALGPDDLPAPGEEALLFSAALFPLTTVLHPSNTGMLNVFEPRYLEMFGDLQRDTPPHSRASFVHILSAQAAPPAALEDAVGDAVRVGVLCQVTQVDKTPDGRMLVEYEGVRRVSIVSITQSAPYKVANVEWVDDDPVPAGEEGEEEQKLAALEAEVWACLLDIERLTKALSSKRNAPSSLPPEIGKYAPHLDSDMTSVDYLMQEGGTAGQSIKQWMRSGSSVGKSAKSKSKAGGSAVDPYKAVTRMLSPRRPELFSFAAAGLIDLDIPARLALLRSRDTSGRLQWVLNAIQPFQQELRTRYSLQKTLAAREDSE